MDLNTIQRQEVDHEGPNTGILLFLFISIGIGGKWNNNVVRYIAPKQVQWATIV